jgi:hypothetical protein
VPRSATCEFYGCPRPQLEGQTYNTEADIPELVPSKTINICAYHNMVTTDPSMVYDVGLSFTREIEIRVGQKPVEPTPT